MSERPAGAANAGERGQWLARRILDDAMAAGLGPAGQLPTERRLAQALGTTRSAVRHALALLESQGLISREIGRGTFLRPASTDGQDDRPKISATSGAFAPADVMAVRRLLEPPAVPLAVAWATAADLAEMDRCVAGGDGAASYEEFESWDLALHRAVIAATHSPLLVTLYAAIEAARHGRVWGDLKRRSASRDRRAQYQADHRELVAALHARDPARAFDAMRRHLAQVSDHLNATDPAAGVGWP